jgi:hypothetical protein
VIKLFGGENMRLTSVIVATALCLTISGCTEPSRSQNGDYWRQRVDRVKVGMSRAAVEKLLPPAFPGPTHGEGCGQVVTYWVDPAWMLQVDYDYTGVDRDKTGNALSYTSPDNKVRAVPTLIRKDMPEPIKIDSLKILEHTEQDAPADAKRPRR